MERLQEIIASIKDLGFTEYEARAYIAALQKGQPVTGYELSKLSGVPTSKIYETIDRLKEKGALWANLTDPVKYVAVNPQQLFRQCQQQFEQTISFLNDNFAQLFIDKGSEQIWNIHGYDSILAKAEDIIENCTDQALVALWPEEAEPLEHALSNKDRVIVLAFGDLASLGTTRLFQHDYQKAVEEEQKNRLFVVTADGEEALIATMHQHAHGVWTTNPALVLIAQEYIKYEIYQVRIMRHFGEEFAEVFGHNLQKLRLG